MSSANPQHEPTMEEILASIRKIISEDQPEGAKPAPQAAPAAPLRAAMPAPAPEIPEPEADVLELTEEVPDEDIMEPVAAAADEDPIENDIVFENIDMETTPEPEHDDLISDNTRNAVGRAFAGLDRDASENPVLAGGTIEAIFVRAVQDAFVPTLQDWVEGHKAEIMEHLKPMIRSWMDEHLPPVIEAVVSKELGKVAANVRPVRRR